MVAYSHERGARDVIGEKARNYPTALRAGVAHGPMGKLISRTFPR
jgi:hypothetical protein